MKICCVTFNIYLCALALLALGGCETKQSKETDPKKQLSILRLHLQSSGGRSGSGLEVPIFRAKPVLVEIEKQFFADEGDIIGAVLQEQAGGFAIEVQFGRHGSWALEKATVSSKGRHIVVFCSFGQDRWLAAPVITKVISNGRFVFAPDATREEAERIVRGLNNMAKKLKTKDNWFER